MRELHVNSTTLARARELRKRMTDSEARLWLRLRNKQAGGYRFRRQHPFGPFILDFYCPECRVAVEVDGDAHDNSDQSSRDQRRDQYLERRAVRVLRVPATAVQHRLERVVDWIESRCRAYSPSPPALRATSPLHGEGTL